MVPIALARHAGIRTDTHSAIGSLSYRRKAALGDLRTYGPGLEIS